MADSNRLIPGCYSQEEIERDARIAELEAELAGVTLALKVALEFSMADLASLEARQCETCSVCAFLDSEGDDTFICNNEECVIYGGEVDIGFGCNEWEARRG